MSNDKNNPKQQGAGLPGVLPGLGGPKPAGGGLPGLGGGLPGLGGVKPAGGGLPGLGGPAAPLGGLPGVAGPPAAAGSGAPVPPFLQQPSQPPGPSPEEMARDPFAADNLPPQRPSFVPADQGNIAGGAPLTEADLGAVPGKSNKIMLIGMLIVGLLSVGAGFLLGRAVGGRVALNVAIRDARIVNYELKKTALLFDETQARIGSALQDAIQKKYHPEHIKFLKEKLTGNPFNARIFTDRNYKKFDAAAVQWLNTYFNKWGELVGLVQIHCRESINDEKVLKTTGEAFKKLLTTQYGVIFSRNKQAQGAIQGDLVVLGAPNGKNVQVQVKPGILGDERELYSSGVEAGDARFSKEPEKLVVPISDNTKANGLLNDATQSHFKRYTKRLKQMADLMKTMRETETNLKNKVSEIASQEPVSLGGFDVDAEVAEYKEKDKKNDAKAAAEAAPVRE